MHEAIKHVFAEQATGCFESPTGLGKFYDRKGNLLSLVEAQDKLLFGEAVIVPNAGAGSYGKVLAALGYSKVETIESSSSAGDWTLAAFDGMYWDVFWQSNRYPYHGFEYARSGELVGYRTQSELMAAYGRFCGW